ncbi:MAG: TonB-linked SusC/RagA family outer membrane protein [Limisphaerales bacterium]|jgi:TonB-linked SusC/RagA family outer membrane protein
MKKLLLCLLCLVSTFVLQGQSLTVSGTLSEEDGETLIGATVQVKGTTKGTASDIDGKYTIITDADAILVFSFIGYVKQEIPVEGRTVIDLALAPDYNKLDEVVVVGFGTQSKRFTTGSIAKVDEEALRQVPSITAEGALQGRAAGVQITSSSAIAGSPVTVRVRGTSSFQASSEPLYVVDGVPIITGNYSSNSANNWGLAPAQESNALAQINPTDIESIEILKDASAAAIYGARGANGVVLITTKSGKAGKTKFNLNYYTGISKETRRIDMINSSQYFELAKEAWGNSGRATDNDYDLFWRILLPQGLEREVAENTDTDWLDEALGRGFMQEASLSASGGNDKTRFFVGGSIRDEKGIITGDEFRRMSGRVNIDHTVNEKFTLGARVNMTYTDHQLVEVAWAGGIGLAQMVALPFVPIYNDDGSYFNPKSGNNLIAEREQTDMVHQGTSLLANLFAQYELLPGLKLRGDIGINNLYTNEHYYKSEIIRDEALATDIISETPSWNVQANLSYEKTIGKHTFDILVGTNAYHNAYTAHQIDGVGFSNPALTNPENATAQTVNINVSEYRFLSVLGRVNYRFNDKWIAAVTARRDASSRFGPDNRWGTFPALSLGWIVSEESFLSSSDVISFLKLRATIGLVGNAEIGDYSHYGSYTSENYTDLPGLILDVAGNSDLGWEETRQIDLGLNIGFLEGRFQAEIALYQKDTRDLLSTVALSSTTGAGSQVRNIGEMQNKGIEISLTSHNIISGPFKWSTNFNVSYNQNEVTSLNGAEISGGLFGGVLGITEGMPIGVRYLVPYAGVAESDMMLTVTGAGGTASEILVEGGDWLFINQHDEVTNIYDLDDRRFLGNAYPLWTGGFSNTMSYKNWTVDFLFTFATGFDIANDEQLFQNAPFGNANTTQTYIIDRWQESGDETDVPKLFWLDNARSYSTDRTVHEADYLRLKSATLAYNLPKDLVQRWKMTNFRVYVRGTNLLTFTPYQGWDPEYNRDGSNSVNQSSSWLPSPQAMTGIFGIDITF